jgi:hypothetical protein
MERIHPEARRVDGSTAAIRQLDTSGADRVACVRRSNSVHTRRPLHESGAGVDRGGPGSWADPQTRPGILLAQTPRVRSI